MKCLCYTQGEAPDTEVGRVYVEDLDDWDLPDKSFRWANKTHTYFDLSDTTGMITMLQKTPEGSYLLEFLVCVCYILFFHLIILVCGLFVVYTAEIANSTKAKGL